MIDGLRKQKIILLYLLTYIVDFFALIPTAILCICISVFSFFYLEYLCEDTEKFLIIKKISHKIVDCFFLMVVQYYYYLFLLAVLIRSDFVSKSFGWIRYFEEFQMICSILLLFLCIHFVMNEKFSLKSISNVMNCTINKSPIYRMDVENVQRISNILIVLEDRTFFERENSYTWASWDFIKIKWKSFKRKVNNRSLKEKKEIIKKEVSRYRKITKHVRGYSTIEMQLMRNIALENGYNCVVRRKIFELIYSRVFLQGLKIYFGDNYYQKREQFKLYILWLYINSVTTKVKGSRKKLATFITHEETQLYDKYKAYIGFLGLSGKTLENCISGQYDEIIKREGLSKEKLMEINRG